MSSSRSAPATEAPAGFLETNSGRSNRPLPRFLAVVPAGSLLSEHARNAHTIKVEPAIAIAVDPFREIRGVGVLQLVAVTGRFIF